MADATTEPPTEPRITPLPPAEWPAEMQAALAALRPVSARHPRPLRGNGRPEARNALGTMARHPALTQAFHGFTGHALFGTTLSLRQRELVVLQVAAARQAEYEWQQHVVLGLDNGVERSEIDAIRAGRLAGFDPLEAAMLSAVRELLDAATISDPVWEVLAAGLDEQQLLDLVFTVGAYDTLAMLFRSFGVPIDDDLRKWYEGYLDKTES